MFPGVEALPVDSHRSHLTRQHPLTACQGGGEGPWGGADWSVPQTALGGSGGREGWRLVIMVTSMVYRV